MSYQIVKQYPGGQTLMDDTNYETEEEAQKALDKRKDAKKLVIVSSQIEPKSLAQQQQEEE